MYVDSKTHRQLNYQITFYMHTKANPRHTDPNIDGQEVLAAFKLFGLKETEKEGGGGGYSVVCPHTYTLSHTHPQIARNTKANVAFQLGIGLSVGHRWQPAAMLVQAESFAQLCCKWMFLVGATKKQATNWNSFSGHLQSPANTVNIVDWN